MTLSGFARYASSTTAYGPFLRISGRTPLLRCFKAQDVKLLNKASIHSRKNTQFCDKKSCLCKDSNLRPIGSVSNSAHGHPTLDLLVFYFLVSYTLFQNSFFLSENIFIVLKIRQESCSQNVLETY